MFRESSNVLNKTRAEMEERTEERKERNGRRVALMIKQIMEAVSLQVRSAAIFIFLLATGLQFLTEQSD
jgi:hypothetical protein